MKYNFDIVHTRRGTNSLKWDTLTQRYGNSDLLPLWVADMDFQVPQQIINRMTEIARFGIYGYSVEQKSFYSSIIKWMKTRHNWDIKEEWISCSPGIVTALNMCIHAYTQPGDKIIIQQPVYYPFMSSITNNKRIISNNALIEKNGIYSINFKELESLASDPRAKMLFLCSPHNPVGRVWTKTELEAVTTICIKHDLVIISDEIHSDLVFANHKHIPFASLSDETSNRTITCTSPSKTFNLARLQISNIIIKNPLLRDKFTGILRQNGIHEMNIFAISALESAYTHGKEWLDQLLDYLYQNYLFLKKKLEAAFPAIRVYPLEGTYLVWIDCRSLTIDYQELEIVLKQKAHVALSQGYIFGKTEGAGFIRINIACPRSTLETALNNIIRALSPFI